MDTHVCSECLDDCAVQEFVRESAEAMQCHDCQRTSDGTPIAAPLSEVSDFIIEGLQSEWSHPEDEAVAWDSEDGQYVVTTLDSYDLVDQYLNVASDELREHLAEQLGDIDWCQKNPYRLTREESWIFDWERFAEQIKHETRYVFFSRER